MAADNQCTKLFVCRNGSTYTLTGPCWYVNSMQTFWVCAGLAAGRDPFSKAPTGSIIVGKDQAGRIIKAEIK